MRWPLTIRMPALRLLVAMTVFQSVLAGESYYTLPENPYLLDEESCCGPHCVCFLDGFFSRECNIKKILADCTPGPLGTSLDQLELACRNLGYFTAAFKDANVETLLGAQCPVIVHLAGRNGGGHFMVALGYDERARTIRGFSPPGNYRDFDPELLRDQMTGLGMVVSDRPLPPFSKLIGQESSLYSWLGSIGMSLTIVASLILYLISSRRDGRNTPVALTKSLCLVVLLFPVGCNSDSAMPDPYNVQLGRVQESVRVTHSFKLVNTSDVPIRVVRVEKSCTCQRVTVNQDVNIAPGASTEVLVNFDTKGLNGRVKQEIVVHTTSKDTHLSAVVMTVNGTVDAGVSVFPSHVMFGNFSGNSSIERKIQLRITDPNYVDVDVAADVVGNPYLAVNMLQRTRGLTTYNVVVDPRIPVGAIYGNISFQFNHPDLKDIAVSLAGTRLGDVKIIPKILAIPKNAVFPLKRNLRLSSVSSTPFQVTNVDASNGTSIREIPRSEPQVTFDIELEIVEHSDEGHNSFVTITMANNSNVPSQVAIPLILEP